MKIIEFETILSDVQAEVETINTEPEQPLESLRATLSLTREKLEIIKAGVLKDGFESSADEIRFFKTIKPQFIALQLYELSRHNLALQRPAGTSEMVKAFYEEQLLQVLGFFRLHAFHYQYYRCKASELDGLYFLRDAEPLSMPVESLIEPNPGFSTAMDYLFAKFMAYERLQEQLLDYLTELQRSCQPQKALEDNKLTLRWTGETINLVELGYGIWLTGQVNGGNSSVTEIIQWLEINFNVKIGQAYRRWWSISKRKRISQTKFIDQMKKAVLKRLDDENELK